MLIHLQTVNIQFYRNCCHHFVVVPNSELVEWSQFATGSNQQGCAEFSNQVESVVEDVSKWLKMLTTFITFALI